MKKLMLFEGYISLIKENKKEKKDLNWIHKSIKKPGALHKALGIPKEDNIPMEKINSKIEELQKEAEGDKKLSKKDRKMLRRLVLAKKLKSL